MRIDAVLKLGGSLIKSGDVKELINEIDRTSLTSLNIVIVVGGGSLADNIRSLDEKFDIDNSTSHYSAIRCMDINSEIIADLSKKFETVENQKEVKSVLSDNKIPVFKTYNFMLDNETYPKSWDITSDSISALVAKSINAEKLVLVKSVGGIKNNSGIIKNIKLEELEDIETNCVDPYLADIVGNSGMNCVIVSGKVPNRVVKVMNGEKVKATYITQPNKNRKEK